MKTVIITGCSGQDGSYLAELHLKKEDKVIGIDRWSPTGNPNLKEVLKNENFILETGDITEQNFIHRIFEQYKPDYFYNMAAISLVPESFKIPKKVLETNTLAVLNILEEIRTYNPETKFLQASSSEQLGKNKEEMQNTESKMIPNSPYAIAKLASFHLTRLYREAYGLFCVNSMCFNHESEKRGPDFVTRKISIAVANIKKGEQEYISLGNMDSKRDWGYAKDYIKGMSMMMEADKADDYTLATGEVHSVREFVEEAFKQIDKKITWKGEGINETGVDQEGKVRVKINEKFYRSAEVFYLHGDYGKIKEKLGWEPKTKFNELVDLMVKADMGDLDNVSRFS